MAHVMDAPYKNNKLLHNRLKGLEYRTLVFEKKSFNDVWVLKTRKNGHDEDLDILVKMYPEFLDI